MAFIPENYVPPRAYQSDLFCLEVLSPEFAEQDFASVTASANTIRHVFGPANSWPDPQMNYAENLADLERHEREFFERKAFAYSILGLNKSSYLGCLYIKPIKSKMEIDLRKSVYDAQAFFWLASQAAAGDLAQVILADLQRWLTQEWRFKAVAFPGRTIGWSEWERMAIAAPVANVLSPES
ncbi:MAG: hypothetical protein ABI171_13250 [Collimonas sp.]|uniref:hypothetical protein n=1 Tax=Collimonas sp. TaxID=1963772 RepID=UPI003263FBA9